ncbi:MAG: RimK family alpha-L-glutamate ligase [Myxococcaceae bacterium]|nr:RimK family alpha-L-glutamate ligase [Myxococcaceae bacterium]
MRKGRGAELVRFAVVTAFPESDWHSARLIKALAREGEVIVVDPARLASEIDGPVLRIDDGQGLFCDAFLLARGVSPDGDADAQLTVYRALETAGALVLNRVEALLEARDKFRTSVRLTAAGVATPRAAIVQTMAQAHAFMRACGQVVVKPLSGSLGEGVERVTADRAGLLRVESRLAREGSLYLQSWVDNDGRDLRVFVVAGRVAGAVARVAQPGEFRTNMARGAQAQQVTLTAAIERLASRAARALGLDYTGVDIIDGPDGPQVIEVNGNPAFDMIFQATGEDMARAVAEHVAREVRARRSRCSRRRF